MINQLTQRMVAYDAGDPMRIQHFLKVHTLARLLGQLEGLDERTQLILEAAALVHDIGIHPAEQMYASSAGKYQEELGPGEAEPMLQALGFTPEVISRVCYLVGHHHTYTDIRGMDYQLLVEADFLVNFYEDEISPAGIQTAYQSIFRSDSGKALCRTMYALPEGE